MVASPTVVAEGVDLHESCRQAIYLDRTYNACHYLRSLDWIGGGRMNLANAPSAHLLICSESIDENIHARLEVKVRAKTQ
jgi:hypothetical protein